MVEINSTTYLFLCVILVAYVYGTSFLFDSKHIEIAYKKSWQWRNKGGNFACYAFYFCRFNIVTIVILLSFFHLQLLLSLILYEPTWHGFNLMVSFSFLYNIVYTLLYSKVIKYIVGICRNAHSNCKSFVFAFYIYLFFLPHFQLVQSCCFCTVVLFMVLMAISVI